MMLHIVRAEGLTALEVVILSLFVPTFGWISLSFWNATTGFALNLAGRDPVSLGLSGLRDTGAAAVVSRTALVMPAHNEDPERLIAGLGAVVRSLEATGQAGHFDVYLLSDTTDAHLARVEEEAFAEGTDERRARLHAALEVVAVDVAQLTESADLAGSSALRLYSSFVNPKSAGARLARSPLRPTPEHPL